MSKDLKAAATKLEEIIKLLDINGEIKIFINEESETIEVNIEGEGLGYMIGQHGRHLESLQYIFNMIINRDSRQSGEEGQRIGVFVDVGGYKRDKNAGTEQMAIERAEDARALGEPIDLEPMSPSQRRVVHTILSQFDDIKTESQGEGDNRYVRIIPVVK